jgi:hypothetical protein
VLNTKQDTAGHGSINSGTEAQNQLESFRLEASALSTSPTRNKASPIQQQSQSGPSVAAPPNNDDPPPFAMLRTNWNSSTSLSSLALSATHLMATSPLTATGNVPQSGNATVLTNGTTHTNPSTEPDALENTALTMSLRDIVKNHFNPAALSKAIIGRSDTKTPPPFAATSGTPLTTTQPLPPISSTDSGEILRIRKKSQHQRDELALQSSASDRQQKVGTIAPTKTLFQALWSILSESMTAGILPPPSPVPSTTHPEGPSNSERRSFTGDGGGDKIKW